MPDASGSRKHALVVVLGDVTHSPRMTAHVRELLGAGYSVDYAGFVPADIGIQFADDVVKSTVLKILHFKWVRVPSYIFPIAALRNAVRLALRLVLLTLSTLWTCLFCVRKRPHLMIVQSPPALPTFIVMPLVRWWHQCDQYIVDWHNLAFTLMLPPIDLQIDKKDSNTVEPSRELNISRSIYQIVVFIAKGMEIALSKLGTTKHLCVSQHLSTWLAVNVGIKAIVLYDRPDPKFFKRLDQSNAFKFLNKLRSKLGWNGSKKYLTVVSSTSWTPDEDMMLLLDSLMVLDKSLNCKLF